ncbi:MAG: hypothetical protein ACI4TC_00710 [Kiritimatiellia bacterium]
MMLLFAFAALGAQAETVATVGETAFVTVTGIAGFADRKFASFAEAYTAIKPTIAGLGLGEESATADAFDALFTSVDENGNATLTYTISGTVVYDETDCANLLTMGRKASHYGNGRHLINFKFVGATGKDTDTLTVNSDITLPYEWWGEKTTTGIHFENLTITGSAPNGLYPSQPFFEGIDFSVSRCALKGIKIYNCSNVEGSYTITDSVLDGTGAPANSYAIHLQGNETAPLSINIKGNTISWYDRGINIDQKTAVATIEGNTISVTDTGRSCIQLSRLATADIVGNTLALTGGNAITLHANLLTLSAAPEVSISGNTVTGTGYLVYDDAVANGTAFTSDSLKLTYATDNVVAATVDTTQGVKGETKYALSETVATTLHSVDPRTLGYATSGKAEALPMTPDMNGEVVNVTAAQAQYVLDGAYGAIDGKTINFTESINNTLILGRASKYDGSKTIYRHGSHDGEALSYADFIAYKNQSVWTESCYYERTVENVTFTANEGVTVKNFEADGGAHIYAGTAPVYDYVRDTGSWVTEGSCYFKRAILKNITFKGLTFKAKTDINTSESTTVYDGFTFKNCTFDLGTTADGNQAIRYYNENNNGNVKNLVVEGCTFKTCYQGVYTAHVKNVTVKDCTFDTTGHNAIAIQDNNGPCDHGAVVITGNTMVNIGDRAIRFNVVAAGTTITITGNTAAYRDGTTTTDEQCIKATTLAEGVTTTVELNNWNNYAVAANKPLMETVAKIGTTDYKSLEDATEAAQNGDVITIVGYTSNMTAPDGWKFETVDGVTTLVADPVLVKGVDGKFHIASYDDLLLFKKMVNEKGLNFSGETVVLDANIDMPSEENWTPVGVSVAKPFKGTFDGTGHVITGIKVSQASERFGYGFFSHVISATVKNVTFSQAEVKAEYSNIVGCVAGYSYGSSTFENVHVTDSLVHAFGKVGGLVGMAADPGATTTFRNCSVKATTIHGTYNVAGFCGLVMGPCPLSGSSLTDVTPIVDEDSGEFGKVVELDTTVVCDGSVATCAGKGTSIKGRYIPGYGYYWSAYSDLYNHYGDSSHDCKLADGTLLANSEVVHDVPVAIGDVRYSDLQAAFDAAKTGDTVKLLSDITLTEQVNITKALDGLTLDGNGKTITCATTDDPFKSGGSALYFGNATDHLYCTGIKIKNLTMTGTAHFAIFLCGGTTTEFTNVTISGNYYIAVNLYGTHGATMTNCHISNSTTGTDKYLSAIWSNVASANPLTLNNSTVDVIAINAYKTANTLEPKIFVMDGSEVGEIHTFDDGSVSGNKKLCVSASSRGTYVIKEYDASTQTWVDIRVVVAITLGGETKEMPLPVAWLEANIGKDASSWTTEALQQPAANGLAKWHCYLFGLDPSQEDAKVVATAGQGTEAAIPLAVANADASPLVTGGYVTVAYVLMGSNDRTAWTEVATFNKQNGLAIPLTGTTYKFYRVDVTVTSAEGN